MSSGSGTDTIVLKMSAQELKIKDELEMAVEKDLEEEIKDGIYGLALKLHRLYQHKKERALKEPYGQNGEKGVKKKIVSEVNINIKMEGGTTIEIKEIKKDAREIGGRIALSIPTPTPKPPKLNRQEKMASISPHDSVKFDWTRSLRSASKSVDVVGRGTRSSNRIKVDGKESSSIVRSNMGSRKWNSSTTRDSGVKTALLELGWKY